MLVVPKKHSFKISRNSEVYASEFIENIVDAFWVLIWVGASITNDDVGDVMTKPGLNKSVFSTKLCKK